MKMVSIFGSVAQLVERTTENREVTGSTPVGATNKTLGKPRVFYYPTSKIAARNKKIRVKIVGVTKRTTLSQGAILIACTVSAEGDLI